MHVLGHNKVGFIGGGQIGYNYSRPQLALGLEADIQGVSGANASAATSNSGSPTNIRTKRSPRRIWRRKHGYLGTVRGRIGFEVTPTLLAYATGGLAYGGVKSSSSIVQANLNTFGAVPGAFSSRRQLFRDAHGLGRRRRP